MNVLDALESIEAAPLGDRRLEALKQADSTELREILTLSLSPQITFGIKKLPELPALTVSLDDPEFDDKTWLLRLRRILGELRTRELTGNDAKERIVDFLRDCDSRQCKWAQRIIRQDLRLNIGAKDVNNTLGEGTIFQFDVPLATATLDKEGNWTVTEKNLKGRWCVQPKLDGARVVAYMPANKGQVVLYSRTGKEYKNFEPVRLKLQEINESRNSTKTMVLDGEVVAYVDDQINFQALQHNLFRKDGKETGKLRYMVWDAAYQEEWENPKASYNFRYAFARQFVEEVLGTVSGAVIRLGLVEGFDTIDPTIERMIKYNLEFAAKGFEGAILRRSEEPVALKRSKNILKVKTFVDDEAETMGIYDGEGKRAGLPGGLTGKMKSGNIFNCGSGFSDDQLKEIQKLAKQGKLPKYFTYKYQPPLTDAGLPRFGIFKGFRHEDDIESAR